MVKDITEIIVPTNSVIKMDIDYEVYNMLDFGGQPCNAEPEFDKDICTQDAFEKKALEKYGCTSPFGPNNMYRSKHWFQSHGILSANIQKS